jgi:hypothetical protein
VTVILIAACYTDSDWRSERGINSIVLLSNGISFAIQIVIFLILGSFAGKFSFKATSYLTLGVISTWGSGHLTLIDFGTWRPNILIGLSLVAWGIGFGWLGIHDASKWEIATGMYIVGCKGVPFDRLRQETDKIQ